MGDDGRYANNGCFGVMFAMALSLPIWAIIIFLAFRIF